MILSARQRQVGTGGSQLPAKALPIPGDAVETGCTDAGERVEDELLADRDDRGPAD